DLGDFGIAPRKVVTTDKFAGEGKPPKRPAASAGPSVIPGDHPLQDLIVPNNESIGARLLRKMGWREGQGVGPKVRRRKRASAPSGPEGKVSMSVDDDEDGEFYKDFLFAPADVEEITLLAKDDHRGIGYRGLDPALAGMGQHFSLFKEQPAYSRSGRRGMSGKAFGVGAFETTDDDIYAVDSMANYDRVLGGEEPGGGTYGWTAPKSHGKGNKGVLDNFKSSAQARPPNKVFPPPVLPKGFRPFHIFESSSSKENRPPQASAATDFKSSRFLLSATQRGALLGEEQLPGPSYVFDFLSPEDRQKLKSGAVSSPDETAPDRTRHAPSPALATPTAIDPRRLQALGSGFKLFARDAAKQQRYEEYLARRKSGKDLDAAPPACDLTEWERQREAEEFVRAASLYQPLTGLMATRFVAAKHKDDEDTVDVPAEEGGDKSQQAQAAEMKMFGKLTRDSLEWHPDSLLCKRFNVPNPYPGSSVIGLPTVKKDKFSVFNFLSMAQPASEVTAPSTSTPAETGRDGGQEPKDKPSRWDRRPALLANVGASPDIEGRASTGQAPVERGNPDEADPETRPPMDLFKAIFADSSSSSSDEDDVEGAEEGVTEGAKETPSRQEQRQEDVDPGRPSHPSGTSAADCGHPLGMPTASNTTNSPQITARNGSGVQTPPVDSGSDSEEMYGPSLPPPSSASVKAVPYSAGVRGQAPAGSRKDPRGDGRHSRSHRKEKRRKKQGSRSGSNKDKKKSKKKKKTKKKKSETGHRGHHRSSSRSDHRGRDLSPSNSDYDASGSSGLSSSSEDSC
ncbi:G patch domain-containing protein 1-like, partial [Acanthaster planci]|uniref:G patch domain-containing protein 1-like n=1 Tax=Acanthaster planci TaxID=133434 RepID=A0A8B8A3M5_ACAPL